MKTPEGFFTPHTATTTFGAKQLHEWRLEVTLLGLGDRVLGSFLTDIPRESIDPQNFVGHTHSGARIESIEINKPRQQQTDETAEAEARPVAA
jgi:hypothetical protein